MREQRPDAQPESRKHFSLFLFAPQLPANTGSQKSLLVLLQRRLAHVVVRAAAAILELVVLRTAHSTERKLAHWGAGARFACAVGVLVTVAAVDYSAQAPEAFHGGHVTPAALSGAAQNR